MSDLNVMMKEHARAGLQVQLDAAVTNGDTEAARKITDQIAQLAVQTAPKAPAYGDAEIKAALESKADWFGIDPRKSGAAIRLGKDMNPKKFATAEAFAEALIKAVDEEFKPAGSAAPAAGDPPENETDEEREEREAAEAEAAEAAAAAPKKPRRTDGPGTEEAAGRVVRRTTGPWAKLSDAPSDVQKEIRRSADKFVSSSAPKENREKFIAKALESHYAAFQRNKGKK